MKDLVICDANILIDYAKSDKRILKIITDKLYDIHVPLPIWDEVEDLSDKDAKELGIKVIEPSLNAVVEASSMHGGGLSDEDNLCFILSRDEKAICATNEKPLRKKCQENGIKIVWGLEMMVKLVQKNYLDRERAKKVAHNIAANNDRITENIIEKFNKKIQQTKRKRK